MSKSKRLPCLGCGRPITRESPTDRRRYHGPDCRPRCSVDGCAFPVHSHGWCAAHSRRAHRTGDPVPEVPRNRNSGECSVEGCAEPMRKRTWCAGHYSMWKRRGVVEPFTYKWVERLPGCLICGGETSAALRRFCSSACDMLYRRWDGVPPTSRPCVVCGVDVVLVNPDGSRRTSNQKMCPRCRRHSRKHGMSVVELATRDGAFCGICGMDVDLDANKDDLMKPSVDHIWPRSRGGTNDPSNLQLAHWHCNHVKRDRITA